MNLHMSQNTFCEIMRKYRSVVFDTSDLSEIFDLVRDLYEAEADALKRNEPYARKTIDEYEAIAIRMSMDGNDFCDAYEEVF